MLPSDPASTGVAGAIAAVSSVLLAVLGVDYYALMSATIAAAFAMLLDNNSSSRRRAAVIMMFSSVIGAMLGTACAEHLGSLVNVFSTLPNPTGPSRSSLMLWSITAATAPRPLVRALVDVAIMRIKKASGAPTDDNAPPPSL